ncbi:MAG TPA: hypothetical protein VI197_20430, partial [Polyangiaceae bacterium]
IVAGPVVTVTVVVAAAAAAVVTAATAGPDATEPPRFGPASERDLALPGRARVFVGPRARAVLPGRPAQRTSFSERPVSISLSEPVR